MDDPTSYDLPYGHFGQADYDPDTREWSFERIAQSHHALAIFGEPRVTSIPAVTTHATAGEITTARQEPASRRHAKQIKDLWKVMAVAQPASQLLPPLLTVSEAVESAVAQYDPLKGPLLAIGTIPSEGSHGTTRVIAHATGSTSSDVRIAEIRMQKRGWSDSKDAWLEVPVVHGEEAVWKGEGAPILSITFAKAREGVDAFMAVRLPTRTLIFRPALRKLPCKGDSRLDPNLVAIIKMEAPGGMSHADVAFNPWFPRQVALVDQAGVWNVWEMSGKLGTPLQRVASGKLMGDEESKPSSSTLNDGWARILWVAALDVVAMCNRNMLAVVHAVGVAATTEQTCTLRFGTDHMPESLADLMVLPSRPECLLLASTTSVSIYKVRKEQDRTAHTLEAVLRLRHFRSPEDVTLNLYCFSDAEGTIEHIHFACLMLTTNRDRYIAPVLSQRASNMLSSAAGRYE